MNISIIQSLNSAALDWGIQCLRYEIRDIQPPANVVDSMHQQVGAERRKRAEILESEGSRQSAINVAEGRKQSAILESEALKMKAINEAKGDAEAVLLRAKASAESITTIAKAIKESGASGHDAVSLKVAEQYIQAYAGLAQKGTTMIVPSNTADIAGNVGAILKVFEGVKGKGV